MRYMASEAEEHGFPESEALPRGSPYGNKKLIRKPF